MAIATLFAFLVNSKMFVACCLNNFYGCYALLHTFKKILIMKKQQKERKQFTISSHQPSQNFPKGRLKEIPWDFGFDLDGLAHAGIIFAPLRKSLRKGKETSPYLKKDLRNYTLS